MGPRNGPWRAKMRSIFWGREEENRDNPLARTEKMKFVVLIFSTMICVGNAWEFGAGVGVGEPFGRAGVALHVNNSNWELFIARHLAWNDYAASIYGRLFGLGAKNQIMLGATYAYNFEEIASGPYRQRISLGAFDLHDFGNKSGFKAYYGFQLARYFPNKNDFEIVIPIIGIDYSFVGY